MGKLSGKVAVVTGANSGIGLATAKRFAQEGARVFMSGRRQRELDAAGGGEFAALGEITEEHFDKTFATNVKGTLFTVQKALPLLKDGASVILTGSTTEVTGGPSFSVYSASKAAIRNFARSWILDLAPRKIRVNVLVPGATSTPEEASKEMIKFVQTTTPLGRLGDPSETASAALFLASDDSSFVTGSELFVDGGSAQI
jgi:NAD(P)-dependent dehydrogenase (short-subunit alcohol dehydrogenase family)